MQLDHILKKLIYILAYVTPEAGPFLAPRAFKLNQLGRGPLDDVTYQISRHCGFRVRQEDFFMFSPYKPM